jgi:hypothetical protein
MRDAIRATGSEQLVTVGQDEGGGQDRPSPAYWGADMDFTTNHTWWLNDALLWDSLNAKYPGKPLLIQETGLQNDFQMDDTWRRDAQDQADVLERKLATALATSAGGIEWLWHVNSYMTLDQEVTIGMVRPDGTEKPEVAMFRALAGFAAKNAEHFRAPEEAKVAIVTSQALQYSALNGLAIAAQQKAVRVMHNYLHVPARMVAANLVAKMGDPQLAVLPSPQALDERTWQELLKYVERGGTLLVTGSVERDAHWVTTERLKALGADATRIDLNFRQGSVVAGDVRIPVSFAQEEQKWLDAVRFADGSTWKEIAHGRGRVLVAAYPVELSEGNEATAGVYRLALERAGVKAAFTEAEGSAGVLVRPTVFADAVLYLFMSESGDDVPMDVKDALTGAEMRFKMPAQRAKLVLIDRKSGAVIDRYGSF